MFYCWNMSRPGKIGRWNDNVLIVENQPCVSVIVVAFQSRSDLLELIPDLIEIKKIIPIQIIIVENDSRDGSVDVIRPFESEIVAVYNDSNIGFAAAVNEGISKSISPAILLLNPDARITAEVLQKLYHYLVTHPDTAAVAPRIDFPDGSLQPSRGTFPSIFLVAAHIFRLKKMMPHDEIVIRLLKGRLGRFFCQYSILQDSQQVDYTTGACVMFDKSKLIRIQCFDTRFFMYYEEIDVAYRLKQAGYKWMFLNTLSVVHTVAGASRHSPLRPFKERYVSMVRYFEKHKPFWQTMTVCRMIRLMSYIMLILARCSEKFRIDPHSNWEQEKSILLELSRLGRQIRRPS
jgi:GT2 family glycosyltransferase